MTQRCRYCSQEIYYGPFGRYEPDIDEASDAHIWRHSVNGYAACLTTRFATPRPEIITLCGSTKFRDAFLAEQARLSLEGVIVISVGLFGHTELPPEQRERGNSIKDALDALHFHKIDISDRIHVINVGGYTGESTRREIEYALTQGKQVTYLEPKDG